MEQRFRREQRFRSRNKTMKRVLASGVLLACLLACLLAQPAARAQGEPFARANRLAFNLGVGFGTAALSGPHELADSLVSGVEGPQSGLQLNAELALRYYLPYHVLGQVGCGALYNWATKELSAGGYSVSFENHNLVLEVPLLVGGYATFFDRLYVYGALGPSIYFFSRSFFDPGADFKAGSGAGFQALLGADFMVGEHFALGLELRYRYLNAGDLMYLEPTWDLQMQAHAAGEVVEAGHLAGDGSTRTFPLDFSGISLALSLRFFAL